jgi:predicted kinase
VALFVISGVPAAGKSTVARLLARRLDRAVYVPGDAIRAMVASGVSDAHSVVGDAQLDQLVLRYKAALALARVYLDAGYDAIVEDVIIGQMLRHFLGLVPVPEMHLIFLDPTTESLADRDRDRTKTAYGEQWNVRQLRDVLHLETARIGLWLDSSRQTAEETADVILGDLNASRVVLSQLSAPAVRRRRRFGPPR